MKRQTLFKVANKDWHDLVLVLLLEISVFSILFFFSFYFTSSCKQPGHTELLVWNIPIPLPFALSHVLFLDLCILLDNSIHASYPTLYVTSYNFLTLFQYQFASLMPLIEYCSCPLLPLSQCQIIFLFMALRLSTDLNLTQSQKSDLSLYFTAAAFSL